MSSKRGGQNKRNTKDALIHDIFDAMRAVTWAEYVDEKLKRNPGLERKDLEEFHTPFDNHLEKLRPEWLNDFQACAISELQGMRDKWVLRADAVGAAHGREDAKDEFAKMLDGKARAAPAQAKDRDNDIDR